MVRIKAVIEVYEDELKAEAALDDLEQAKGIPTN